ncbi:MAG: 4-alpha-glucanotransferase [Gammaproteobacteria bacterium]|nr:4-alpha-glucanotransferase [Gammaproteobacteria bacterium]
MGKKKGVLCHLTSLPNQNLEDAKKFIALLSENNVNAWQMLPITPPDNHNSPYASSSAFAGWDELITSNNHVSAKEDSYWIDDWALFCSIKSHFNDIPWTQWPIELRDRHPDALAEWREKAEYKSKILDQNKFQAGWNELHDYANKKNVSLIGDVPIFVAHDSADVWAHRHLFQLEDDGNPSLVSGVPPDYFSEDGQKWGTVLYQWDAHENENYKWWKERISRMLNLFDVIRIDHFRGFHSAWAIPIEDEHARNGFWQEGPGQKIIEEIIETAGSSNRIIAEDLGIIPQEVIELREKNKLKGMAILQFGFEGDLSKNPHFPKNIKSDLVVYSGTHDNDTTKGWLENLDQSSFSRIKNIADTEEINVDTIIKLALSSNSELVIIPLQDILKLDSQSRMNTPGTIENNWKWKFLWNNLLSSRMHWFGTL